MKFERGRRGDRTGAVLKFGRNRRAREGRSPRARSAEAAFPHGCRARTGRGQGGARPGRGPPSADGVPSAWPCPPWATTALARTTRTQGGRPCPLRMMATRARTTRASAARAWNAHATPRGQGTRNRTGRRAGRRKRPAHRRAARPQRPQRGERGGTPARPPTRGSHGAGPRGRRRRQTRQRDGAGPTRGSRGPDAGRGRHGAGLPGRRGCR